MTSKTVSPTFARGGNETTAPRRSFGSVRTLLLLVALGSLGWLVVAPSTPALILLVSSVIGTFGWNGAPSGAPADLLDL